MTKSCQVLGTHASYGNSISHSHQATRRKFQPNLQQKRYWVPSLGRHITLQVSAKGIKTIDRRGIESIVAQLQSRGELKV
ncbi:50S ribosomal protein L28 [Bifidobacterium sp.]|jgi:large subunit ribosomal protein L28|uniref:50S ribosomal protein L28 n=1 Tax=Bifidobacterium sp. TaxID=41200 RepID=UPI0025BE3A66|nr:50S ribosomal protein L28 [Bifidobacterium sp.]MCH4159927.1 50S ribosomal protein L28 [Bifidobacterium sp.]MCH4175124.1 50S ribosomal protein L28 [Bifidobacterium sp.]MCI1635475.1 50S ribosomal protein L28 [Bifidobacterium sp.]